MSVGTLITVEQLQALAGRIESQASSLESTLSALRRDVTRDDSFQGSAATAYDDFLVKWDTNQRNLLDAMHGAGQILANLANTTEENNQRAAVSFG